MRFDNKKVALALTALLVAGVPLVRAVRGDDTKPSPAPQDPKPADPNAKPGDAKPGDAKPGDTKPAEKKALVALSMTVKVLDAASKEQKAQYFVAERLAFFGIDVDSRIPSFPQGDKYLKGGMSRNAQYPGKVLKTALPADAKNDDQKANDEIKLPPTDYTVEGVVDLHYNPTMFYGKVVAHIYAARVDVTIKDAKGQVEKIAFVHDYGQDKSSTQEKVAEATEQDAVRFVTLKLLTSKALSDKIAPAKKDEYAKWVKAEQEYYDKTFSDGTKRDKGNAGGK